MEYCLNTRLNGNVAMTSNFHENESLKRNKSLYKLIWVQKGSLVIEIDHVAVRIDENELFNSNFYCIFGHDSEVSCYVFLFNGSSNVLKLKLTPKQVIMLKDISGIFMNECGVQDDLQEEMLRIILKRFIITCTRIAREKFFVDRKKEKRFDIVRQYYVLVDKHFKEKKQVQDYADMLCRTPKTLSNLFSEYGFPPPLRVIHERVEAEAKRLLLYTSKSAKEIGNILGFEDLAAFSRFFKKMTQESISEYRKRKKQE